MILRHKTNLESAVQILKQGIKPPKDTGVRRHWSFSQRGLIYFTAAPEGIYGGFCENEDCVFFLNMEWAREHKDQFRVYSGPEVYENQEFKRFVEDYGFASQPLSSRGDDSPYGITSLKPIPLEGLESLTILKCTE